MNYHTKKLLSLTDKNLYFSKDCFVEEKFREITTSSIRRRLNYALVCFTKYWVKNEGQIIKYGTHKVRIKLLPVCSYKIILELKKNNFLCKECGSTFNVKTKLIEENGSILSEVKRKIAMKLTINSSRKDSEDRYFVSDVTVMRKCVNTFNPKSDCLISVLCFL